MTTTTTKPKKDSVYKTDEGADLLLDPSDPKYQKPRAKKVDPIDALFKQQDDDGFGDLKPKPKKRKQFKLPKLPKAPADYGKLRPVMGWLLIPYIVLYQFYKLVGLPVLRALAFMGNELYDIAIKDKGSKK